MSSYATLVVEDTIYYIGEVGVERNLYKMNTDGTGSVKIADGNYAGLLYSDGWLYFVRDNIKLYRMNTDGIDSMQVDALISNIEFNVYDGWLYFANYEEDGILYKVRLDGTGETKLGSRQASKINIAGGWIFYQNGLEPNSFYKMKLDGSVNQKVN